MSEVDDTEINYEVNIIYRGREQVDTWMLEKAGSMKRYKEMVMLAICDNATDINEPLPDDSPKENEDGEEDIVRILKGDQKLSMREINEL